MLKKFVPLNSNASPSTNPYEVRTYMGEQVRGPEWKSELCGPIIRPCQAPDNSTISKVLTIEDELRCLHQRAKESRFQHMVKKKCSRFDDYTTCTLPQRTPDELRVHAVMRERYLKTIYDSSRRVHDAAGMERHADVELIELHSPHISEGEEEQTQTTYDEEGQEEDYDKPVKPQQPTPSCSEEAIYAPSPKLLELRRPKSGMFHNMTPQPMHPDDNVIPYSSYNPRLLQEQYDVQDTGKCLDVLEGRTPNDLWTWNMGVAHRESELDRAFIEAKIRNFDCDNMELAVFKIPKDLDKTFAAELVFGTAVVKPEEKKKKFAYYHRPREVAALYYAFVETFRLNPDFWTSDTMDHILANGEKLLAKSVKMNYKSEDTDFDILPQLSDKKAEIGLKVHFTGPMKSEPNIYKALSLYFSKYNAALLVAKNLFLLIWKRCRSTFYIFDPNGRVETCHRDFENGKCSLISTNFVEHLVHLIVTFSEVDMDSEFNLYEIYLKNYGKIPYPISTKFQGKRTRRQWAVVNDSYAVIPAGHFGIQQPITGTERNASMVISLLAMLYSNIHRAPLWRTDVMDDLIKFGQSQYKKWLKILKLKKKKKRLNVADIPDALMIGTFRTTLKKHPFLYTGHVADCRTYLDSQLTAALKELFSGKWEAALLQIDNSVIALWRDGDYFYVFDPFRRGRAGQVLDPDDFLTRGVGVLQMHTNFESFCRILYQKALKLRRGGKFFLHGISIGCIRPQRDYVLRKKSLRRYTKLQLTYPVQSDELPPVIQPLKQKGKKPYKVRSIESLPDLDRIPEFDTIDLIDSLIEEYLCDLLKRLPEPSYTRPVIYKQAEKLLLHSDKDYLKSLQWKLRHGEDYDNMYAAYSEQPEPPPKPLTLEQELRVRSNFDTLPDGTWVIFGKRPQTVYAEEVNKFVGLLSSIITAALSKRYKISTWNSDLVDFALEAVSTLGEDFPNYEQILSSFLAKKLPKISIGTKQYYVKAEKVMKSSLSRSLRQILLESLINSNRLLVICQRFSCLILKRYNFLYMFIGYPCNSVGYRKYGPGPGCMLRFVELDSLIRRIEFGCNPEGCEITNYVAVAVKVLDITNLAPERFLRFPNSDEEAMYAVEYAQQKRLEESRMNKMRFLERELRNENLRIKGFLTEKEKRVKERKRQKRLAKARSAQLQRQRALKGGKDGEEEDLEEMDDEEGIPEEEEEEEVELKHKPGKKMMRETQYPFKPRPVQYGYRIRSEDCMYKIQGTTAVEGRTEAAIDRIKPCFFVSTLAILYAILRPLNQWSSQRVDRVVEGGKLIASRVSNMASAFDRYIKNVTIDDYKFDVWVKTYDPAGVWGASVESKISRATQTRRYLLLQLANGTFAIYRDDFYHLFDPYNTMDMTLEAEQEEESSKEKKKCPRGCQRFKERRTASWILFADVESMLSYIDKRAVSPDWQKKEEFAFHIVDVLSYKKAPPTARILQLLTDLAVPPCSTGHQVADEADICAHAETISWLDMENFLPVWSRMNRRNSAGRYRNLPLTKLKKYDIEIDGRLWSLWGNLHPQAPVFDMISRGKQYLACCVMACCATQVYNLIDWSPLLLDTLVINGDKYHRDSLKNIKQVDYEFSLEDLNLECTLESIKFVVHIEHVAFGKLYARPTRGRMNLADALMYFFSHFQCGILSCNRRYLAIGRTIGIDGGYFMYDCQSRDHPLFPKGQGASYVLRTKHLQVLLYCLVVTLSVPYFNVNFALHKVQMLRDGASVAETEEEEEEEETR